MAEKSFRRLFLVLAASLLLSGCAQQADPSEETEPAEEAAVAVKAVSAQIGTLAVSNEFIGTVSPQQQVTVMPMVSGEVDQVYFEVGDEVKAGDVLFHIKDDAARLQKENAELTRKSAEITAQMQLGSSQVMNNISMQSNIRSIEFQIENAKDQYQSAVDGIVDAQQAKTEMEDALSEIESSLAEMNANQARRSEVVARAERYIDRMGSVNGNYRYRVAYDYPEPPDYYEWPYAASYPGPGYLMPNILADGPAADGTEGTPESGESAPETEVQSSEESEPSASEADGIGEGQQDSGDGKDGDGSETAPVGTEASSEESSSAGSETDETAGTGAQSEEESVPGNTSAEGKQKLPGLEGLSAGESLPGPTVQEKSEETAFYSRDGIEGTARGYYFSGEVLPEGHVPARSTTDLNGAKAAYREQQEINAAKADAEELGYDAYDIGSGAASSEILEHAAQIAALEYQASQLRSNQASLDSSIDQAVTARDTTEKTIDFYEDNLQDAQVTYGIANGQAYQDSAAALATQMQAADVGIKSANLQLEYYSPTSPISGTVVSRSVEQYGLAQPGYAAFVISNQDAMNVTFSVSEQVRANLYVGMPVTLEKNGNTFTGTVMEIGEAADAQSGGLFVIKAVTEAGGDQLISGTAVKLTVDTFRTENAVLIPYDAVHFESEQAYVFVVTEEDTAVRTPVTLGLMSEDMVEVTEGISAGDRLVATWSTQLEDGVKVRVIGAQTAPEETGE